MRDEWYVARRGPDGNKRYGPVPLSQLRDLMGAGDVLPNDLVWREGMAEWQRVDQCAALAPPRPAPRDYGRGYGADRDPRGYEPEYDDRPYRRRYSQPSSNGWVIGLVVGIGVVAALCFLGLAGLVFAAILTPSSSSYTTYPVGSPASNTWNNGPDDPPPFPNDPNLWAPPQPPDLNQWQPNPPVFVPPDPPIFMPPDPPEIVVPDPPDKDRDP